MSGPHRLGNKTHPPPLKGMGKRRNKGNCHLRNELEPQTFPICFIPWHQVCPVCDFLHTRLCHCSGMHAWLQTGLSLFRKLEQLEKLIVIRGEEISWGFMHGRNWLLCIESMFDEMGNSWEFNSKFKPREFTLCHVFLARKYRLRKDL